MLMDKHEQKLLETLTQDKKIHVKNLNKYIGISKIVQLFQIQISEINQHGKL